MPTKISVYRDNVWVGDGIVTEDWEIVDCPALLGRSQDESDECYEAIMDYTSSQPQDGDAWREGEIKRPDGVYSWTIEDSTDVR